jgi:hypothetical protein
MLMPLESIFVTHSVFLDKKQMFKVLYQLLQLLLYLRGRTGPLLAQWIDK